MKTKMTNEEMAILKSFEESGILTSQFAASKI
jgi:hypothetical protein